MAFHQRLLRGHFTNTFWGGISPNFDVHKSFPLQLRHVSVAMAITTIHTWQQLHIISDKTLAHTIITHMLSSPTEATMLPWSIHYPRVGRGHRVGGRSEGGMREWVGLAHVLEGSEVNVPHLPSSADAMETSWIIEIEIHISYTLWYRSA